MKITTLFLVIIALQFALMLFGSAKSDDTAIFGFINNPTNWGNTTFILMFGVLAAGITLAGAFVGSLIFGKTDLMVFAGATVTLIGFCIPITSLWQLIYQQTGLFGSTYTSGFIASIITAPLAIFAIFTIIGWWRSNSEM